MVENALIRQSEFLINLIEDVFLTECESNTSNVPIESQRHIDAIESHPIDFTFPTLPIPVSIRITESADIHVVSVLSHDLHCDYSIQLLPQSTPFRRAEEE